MLPIVVVGAGLAGATAAWSLATQGRGASVLVIESRQRLGGRLTNGVDVLDMGAAWTWPSHDSTLALLAKAAGVSSYRQVDKGAAVMDLGPGMVQATPGRVFSEELRFAGGSAAIPVGLLDEAQTSGNCEVKTGCAVTRIAQCDDGECLEVSYKCAGEGIVSTKASHVVLTVPPRLAHAKIAFDPALPAEVARAMSASPTWMVSACGTTARDFLARPAKTAWHHTSAPIDCWQGRAARVGYLVVSYRPPHDDRRRTRPRSPSRSRSPSGARKASLGTSSARQAPCARSGTTPRT